MTGWNVNHDVGFIAQNHCMGFWVHWRPTGKEDGVLEHGLDALLLETSLLMEEKCGRYRRTLGVSDNGVERASFLHDLEQELERIVGAAVSSCYALSHKLTHGILWRFAVRKVSDP